MLVYLALILIAPNVNALDLVFFKYGKLKRDREVNRIFQTYEILPDHKYYASGPDDIPYAIIGIQNEYNLRPGLWKKINLTTPLLRSWVSQMDNIYGYPPYGSAILDHKKNPVGIWYSSKQWTTVIIEENNQVAVLVPEKPGFKSSR